MTSSVDPATSASLGDSSLYSLFLTNKTKDVIYVGDVERPLASPPDGTGFVEGGSTFASAVFSRQVTMVAANTSRAAGSSFYVLRFKRGASPANAATVKDLFDMAETAVSVVYGSSLAYDSGPVQAGEEGFTDGPTTVTMDAGDGYEMKAYVEDTTRRAPDLAYVIAIAVLCLLGLAFALGTWHTHMEMRAEHKALLASEPPRVQRMLGMVE